MTDPNAKTLPAPPLPASSIPPRDAHIEAYAVGRALDGLQLVDQYIRGRCDGELADAVNKMARKEAEERDAFRREMREFAARIEKKVDAIVALVRPFGQRLTAVEANCSSNHEPPQLKSLRPQVEELEAEAL